MIHHNRVLHSLVQNDNTTNQSARCMIKMTAQPIRTRVSVLLISVPVAPNQASITTIMETSLQVSWTQSDPLDLVLQYMVQVKSGAGDWEQVNDTIKGSSVLVNNLDSFTAYSFRVSAKNGLGMSPYSQPSLNTTTLEGGMRNIFSLVHVFACVY